MNNNIIYRQDAINSIKELPRWIMDPKGEFQPVDPPTVSMVDPEDAMSAIEKLPSAQPERKTGKWIKVNDSCTIRCNQCGQEMTSLCDIQLPNYCLNCGVDMRGKRDDI